MSSSLFSVTIPCQQMLNKTVLEKMHQDTRLVSVCPVSGLGLRQDSHWELRRQAACESLRLSPVATPAPPIERQMEFYLDTCSLRTEFLTVGSY